MRISDWSSDVCSSYLGRALEVEVGYVGAAVDLAVAHLHELRAAGYLLVDGVVAHEAVAALVEVGEVDRLAHLEGAAVGLLLAGDHPEQRRLAGAVRTDHADDAGGRELEGEVLYEEAVAVALRHVVGLDHHAAEPAPVGELDLELLGRSEEHTSELQSLMRISYAVFCVKKKNNHPTHNS